MTGFSTICRCRRVRASIEFARLNLTYTMLSKRGADRAGAAGPCRPAGTIRACRRFAGLRRRGVPPEAIRDFVDRIGVAKANSVVDVAMFEHCGARGAEPDRAAPHGGAAAAQGRDRELSGRTERGARGRQPSRRSDGRHAARSASAASSMSNATTSWRTRRRNSIRLSPGREVRLRYAYFITCREVVKDAAGEVVELRCTYDPATRGGNAPDGRKVQATLHWVSAADSRPAEVRLYHHLFTRPDPNAARFRRPISIRNRWKSCAMRGSSLRWRRARAPTSCNSNGRAISSATATRRRGGSCSTAPSGCAIRGRRSPAKPATRGLKSPAKAPEPSSAHVDRGRRGRVLRETARVAWAVLR